MKTRAAILWETHKPLVLEDIEVPALKKGQVLVKVLYSGGRIVLEMDQNP